MKTPKNYDEEVPLDTLADGYCKSINNARRLIEDGEILINIGRYLSALNSFRLAIEELAKAHLINQAVLFDESDKWKWFWSAFHDHREKIRILEYEFHWPSYQDKNKFDKRVHILKTQREESIYVQFDSNKKEFLCPEDFFRSREILSHYAINELSYTKLVYGMFTLAGEPKPDFMLKVFKHQRDSQKGENLNISEKKFSIRGYISGQNLPAMYEEADTIAGAREIARRAMEQTNLESVVFWEEVEKGQKGVAITIQRNEKNEIEEIEGWHYGENDEWNEV